MAYHLVCMILHGHGGFHVGCDGHCGCQEKGPRIWEFFETKNQQASPVNGHWLPVYYFQRDDYLDTAKRMRPEWEESLHAIIFCTFNVRLILSATCISAPTCQKPTGNWFLCCPFTNAACPAAIYCCTLFLLHPSWCPALCKSRGHVADVCPSSTLNPQKKQ